MTSFRPVAPVLLVLMCGRCAAPPAQDPLRQKPRVVVTTDPELDDANSLIRYLLYSTDFRTEGLIYASSGFHWKGDASGKKVSVPNREYSRFGLNLCPCESWRWAPDEHFIDLAVATYEQVYPNLRVHDRDYPTPAELQSKIRWGNVEFDGDISQDTPGSDLIKALLLDDEPGPIYLLAWGGQSTIARALKSIEEQYRATPEWSAIQQQVSRKAILSPSGDQDDTYATYIQPNWPDIRTLPAGAGGVALGYGAQATASAENAVYYSAGWTRENISSLGPLGALYRVWGDGKQIVQGDIFDYSGRGRRAATIPQPELHSRRPERLHRTHPVVSDSAVRRRQPRTPGDAARRLTDLRSSGRHDSSRGRGVRSRRECGDGAVVGVEGCGHPSGPGGGHAHESQRACHDRSGTV